MAGRFGASMRGSPPALAALALLAGCSGPQSALDPAGVDARALAELFWFMTITGGVIWLVVVGFAFIAARPGRAPVAERKAHRFILWAGVVPTSLALVALLAWTLPLMPAQRAAGDGLRIAVEGRQWWWRVTYHPADGSPPLETANEIRLPLGERVQFELSSPDVIHSFWIAPLGGKVDMIPGRTTTLTLEPDRTGTFRGVCAEFCGSSHALMAFSVEVMEPDAFAAWLKAQRADQAPPGGEAEGARLFGALGCGGCHAIRGTEHDGSIGPDLTHLASRNTLAAGTLPMTREAMRNWLEHTQSIKPGVLMPSFGMLEPGELDALSGYLAKLR